MSKRKSSDTGRKGTSPASAQRHGHLKDRSAEEVAATRDERIRLNVSRTQPVPKTNPDKPEGEKPEE